MKNNKMKTIKKLEKFLFLSLIIMITLPLNQSRAKLLALYQFEGNTEDITGHHHGTAHGNPKYTEGKIGRAIDLDGLDDFISIEIPDPIKQFSIALWLKVKGGIDVSILCSDKWEEPGSIHFQSTPEYEFELCINASPEISYVTSPTTKRDQWYHLVITYNALNNQGKYYINGNPKTPSESSFNIPLNSKLIIGSASIGANNITLPPIEHFGGLIDDLAIFDHILTDNEVMLIYYKDAASLYKYIMESPFPLAEKLINESKYKETMIFLNNEIEKYERKQADLYSKRLLADLYFFLAKAKEGESKPRPEIISAYKESLSRLPSWENCATAAAWLYMNVPAQDYKKTLLKCTSHIDVNIHNIGGLANHFASTDNWPAFEIFLDAFFSQAQSPINSAKAIGQGLKENETWSMNFLKYCERRQSLKKYAIEYCLRTAQEKEQGNQYSKAAELYHYIAGITDSEHDKADYTIKEYECLFQDGQYEKVMDLLSEFVKENITTNRVQVIQAILLKGRLYVQIGKTEQATNCFLTVIFQYPNSQFAPEAAYLVGYLYMLQGQFKSATEAFKLVTNDYPQSSFALKAHESLNRVQQVMFE